MTHLVLILLASVVLLACIKACYSAKLRERDPQAWEKLQHHEDEKRRQRQQMLGQALLAVFRTFRGWFTRDDSSDQAACEEGQ